MYLFTRRTRLVAGDQRGALAWATDITQRASQISGLPITLNTPVFGDGAGTMVWATMAEDLTQLEASFDKLQIDDSFISAADAGAKYNNGLFDDTLLQIVHGAPDPSRQLAYVSVVNAVAGAGKAARAVELGVEIAQRAEKVSGIPGIFGVAATGPYGALAWISGYESIGQLEQANQALGSDPKWLAFLDKETPGVYTEDASVTRQTLYRRIG